MSPPRRTVAIAFGAKPDSRLAPAIFRHVAHLSAAPFPIGGPFFGKKQTGFLWRQVDDIADVVRRHVYPINSVREFFCETYSHIMWISNVRALPGLESPDGSVRRTASAFPGPVSRSRPI